MAYGLVRLGGRRSARFTAGSWVDAGQLIFSFALRLARWRMPRVGSTRATSSLAKLRGQDVRPTLTARVHGAKEAGNEAVLVAKGWIIPATCETYGTVAFLAIKVGQEASKAGWNAGLR